jgi:hypothetical protein
MLTQEQAKQILVLASSYASIAGMNEAVAAYGCVDNKSAEREKQAWEKLDGYVRGLVEKADVSA